MLCHEAVKSKQDLNSLSTSTTVITTIIFTFTVIVIVINVITELLPADSHPSVNCLERVTNDLQSHIEDINNKLLSIASQSISAELQNWEAKPPVPSKSFQNISRFVILIK